jgi:ornithine carbamoyltransferase
MPAVKLRRTSGFAGAGRRALAVATRAGESLAKPPAREERGRGILKMASSDFLRDQDLSGAELVSLLDLADEVKRHPGDYAQALAGKSIALLFEKPSLRTRLTFELAMKQMGGGSVFVEGPIGVREPLKDVARNLDRWARHCGAGVRADHRGRAGGVVVGAGDQRAERRFIIPARRWPTCRPFANISADLGTEAGVHRRWQQRGAFADADGAAAGNGFRARLPGRIYDPNPDIVAQAEGLAAETGGRLQITHDTAEAVAGAHAVYTDVWASMGQEQEAVKRKKAFRAFQVSEALFAQARPDAVFHALPAGRRGEEVSDGVMESPRSRWFSTRRRTGCTRKRRCC